MCIIGQHTLEPTAQTWAHFGLKLVLNFGLNLCSFFVNNVFSDVRVT